MANFLDKVIAGVDKGVNSVSEGSKQLVERARINNQIQAVENEKNELFLNMGKLVFNLYKSGEIQIDQCAGIYENVEACEQRIKDLQEQLVALEAAKSAKTYQTPYQPTYQPPQQSVENGKMCSCGCMNKETAKFCAKCGSPLE